eukprot:6214692-Pleurochrysis_carterae.AAC.3
MSTLSRSETGFSSSTFHRVVSASMNCAYREPWNVWLAWLLRDSSGDRGMCGVQCVACRLTRGMELTDRACDGEIEIRRVGGVRSGRPTGIVFGSTCKLGVLRVLAAKAGERLQRWRQRR